VRVHQYKRYDQWKKRGGGGCCDREGSRDAADSAEARWRWLNSHLAVPALAVVEAGAAVVVGAASAKAHVA